MKYKTILSIPDQHIVGDQNLRRFEALGHFIEERRPDYVVNGGDMFEAKSLYGITAKKSWQPKDYLIEEVDEDLRAGEAAIEFLWAPSIERNKKLRRAKKRGLSLPQRIFCLGNHDLRIVKFTEFNPKTLSESFGVSVEELEQNPLRQNDYWDETYDYQVPVEVEGILFSHNYSSGTATASNNDTILKIASQSACGFHTHKAEFSASYTATGRPTFVCQSGWFADPDDNNPDWVGPQGGRSWWNGFTVLHGVDGTGYFEPEYISTERLLRNYL